MSEGAEPWGLATADDVVVVVLTYGSVARHKALIELALDEGVPPDHILVVHNPDGTHEGAEPWVPEGASSILMERNVGYGSAMNAGIEGAAGQSGARWALLLTHDVQFAPGGMAALLRARARAEGYAVLGPALNEGDPERVYSFGGVDDRQTVVRHLTDRPPADSTGVATCHWVDGCAMLVRTAAATAVGGINGEFFMYFDETEFCLRLRQSGWKVGLVLDAVAKTSPGGLTRPASYGYLFCRNGLAYARASGGRRGMLRAAVSQLRLAWEVLPKPWDRRFYSFGYQASSYVWLVGIAWGFVDFSTGRGGPPPALLQRLSDISGTRR